MIVDNKIDGDSRVQKCARSMAEAGWEVHLIGRSMTAHRDDYRLGEAYVHRLPLPVMPLKKTLRQRFAPLRHPFGYATVAQAQVKQRRIRQDWIEIDARMAGKAAQAGSAKQPKLRRLPLPMFKVVSKLRRGWLKFRLKQTNRAVAFKGRTDGIFERLEVWFWKALMGDGAWRRLDPLPLRFEAAYRSEILRLEPDLIHAQDFRALGIAARATAHIRRTGGRVRMLYDAHEFVPGIAASSKKVLAGLVGYEREYLPYADAIVTVSPPLASMLMESHRLAELPSVTLNAPPAQTLLPSDAPEVEPSGVRAACGLPNNTPLIVYCGGSAVQRCLHTIVESLPHLPGVHAAFIVNNLTGAYVTSLRKTATDLGVDDRIHFMPYVPYNELVTFLASADVGIHPLRKGLINHEVALATKFFEFMQAKLPVVVSDVRAMSEEVNRLGNGETFRSEDAADLARAVKAVLAKPDTYKAAYDKPGVLEYSTWEAQTDKYVTLYERLLTNPRTPSQTPRVESLEPTP